MKIKLLCDQCNSCKFSKLCSNWIHKNVVNYELGGYDEICDSWIESWSKHLVWQHYRTRPNPNLAVLTHSEKNIYSEYNNRNRNTVQELILETQEVTIACYVDVVKVTVKNNSHRCVLLIYKYQYYNDFDKNKQHGDYDFFLNYLKFQGKVQSEYYNIIQYYILVCVWYWIDAHIWDLVKGDIRDGFKVSVDGEISFESPNPKVFLDKDIFRIAEMVCTPFKTKRLHFINIVATNFDFDKKFNLCWWCIKW